MASIFLRQSVGLKQYNRYARQLIYLPGKSSVDTLHARTRGVAPRTEQQLKVRPSIQGLGKTAYEAKHQPTYHRSCA